MPIALISFKIGMSALEHSSTGGARAEYYLADPPSKRCRLIGHLLSNARRLECREYARRAEGHAMQTDTGGIEDCVGDRREHGFARCLPASVGSQIGPVWIRISVHQHDVDPFGRIGMGERGRRVPIHAGDLLGIELHFFVERAAQRVEHRAFDGVTHRHGVDHQSAVMRAYQPFYPDMAGPAIHFHLGDLGDDGIVAECVG